LIGAPVLAHAEPTEADLAQARELRNQGRELRSRGDLRGALAKFKAAHAVGQTAVTGIELARTHALLRELVEAREVCLWIGRMAVAPDETHFSQEAREEATKMAEELRPRIPELTVKIRGVPPGAAAQIRIDGQHIPDAVVGEARKVNPGAHEIIGRIGDGQESKETLNLEEGEKREVTLTLIPPPVVVKPKVEWKAPEPDRRASRTLYTLGLVVGGPALLIGTVSGIAAFAQAGDVKSRCPGGNCPPPVHSDLSAALTMGNVSNVAFAVAGVSAVLLLIGFAIDPGSRPQTAAAPRASAWIGLGSAGVHGSF
jgi:hypothetical protein